MENQHGMVNSGGPVSSAQNNLNFKIVIVKKNNAGCAFWFLHKKVTDFYKYK